MTWGGRCGKGLAIPKEKSSLELPCVPAISPRGIHPKELKGGSQTDPRTPTFTAASSTMAQREKQPEGPSVDEGTDNVWVTRTMEYRSAFKRKGIRTPATTWINLGDIMQSEISQGQMGKYGKILLDMRLVESAKS